MGYVEADITPEGFTRFLVTSPLKPRPKQAAAKASNSSGDTSVNKRTYPYGSYHQKHYIDDKLVAVGMCLFTDFGLHMYLHL